MNQQLPRRAPIIAAAALAGFGLLAMAGCSKADPEENCRLWMNNDAGWAEMSLFVADKANDAKLRGRCLEILVAEGGQPSQVLSVTEKAPDRVDLLVGLEPSMIKLLQNGSVKQKGHAKIVLFAILKEGKLPEAKAAELKAKLADWAFADFKHEMDTESLKAALKERVTPDDIEVLGPTAVPGVEVMLGKGISKGELVAFLKSQNTPEAKKALVAGLKRYHSTKNVKISEADLGDIQATDTLAGYVYFLELYRRFADVAKPHPDDKRAADLAIRVALQWTDPDDDKKKPEELEKLKKDRLEALKGAWDQVGPLMEQLLTGRNCDDRWYATQMLVATQGAKGLETALGKLPDDTNYGQEEFAANDAKKMIVDLCLNEIKTLGADAARPVLEATLKSSPHAVSRLVAARCLAVFGDPASLAVLKAFDKKDPIGVKNVQPVIVTDMAISVGDIVQASVDTIDYCAAVDKLAAEGKIDADTAKFRKNYALYSFYRKGKELAKFAEEMATDKIERDKAKKAGK